MDNGCSHSNERLSLICGSIGTALLRTKIRDGSLKAKIERQFRTLKETWLYTLDLDSITSLEKFDGLLKDYMRSYNTAVHSGMGKPFALRRFARSLNPNICHMEFICLSTVSVMEFYRQFRSVLEIDPRGGKPGMFRTIQEQILYLYRDKKQPLLLAIDEAQCLSTGILEDLKTLMNYGHDSLNCFTLILCGEPHLNSALKKPVHEALRQRITVHCSFSGLSDSEAAQCVLHKLACAGGAASIIGQAALSAIHSYSQGSPRLVDNLMANALTLGAQMEKTVSDTDVILVSVSSQNLG